MYICSCIEGVCSVLLLAVARSFVQCVQLSQEKEKKRKKRLVCMSSSLLESMLGVDRQSDKHTVSVYDV